jgi:hypothetical protein
VTHGPRLHPLPALARRLALVLAALGVLALAVASCASALVVEAETSKVKAGVQPRSTLLLDGLLGYGPKLEPVLNLGVEAFSNPSGAPVLTSSHVYAVYWDPTDNYHGDWQHLIDTFLQGMGAESGSLGTVFSVDAQYTDATNQRAAYRTTFMGAYTDTQGYPPVAGCSDPRPLEAGDAITCLTDQQIREQLGLFISSHSLPKGMGNIYYVLTPPGVTVCLDAGGPTGHCSDYEAGSTESYENSFCSYHSDESPTSPTVGDANTILYAVIPWTAGGLGDGHLTLADEKTPAYDCQDGGYNPTGEPIEQPEEKKEKTKKQKAELEEKTLKEQQKAKEEEELEGPHQEEPNQAPGRSPDGFFDTGLADLIINQIAAEQQNIVTDPLLNAWQDPFGKEATDECRDFFAPAPGGGVGASKNTGAGTLSNQTLAGGNYYLNDAFSLAALELPFPGVPCINAVELLPRFTAPNPVNAGELVDFDGMESDISLDEGTVYNAKDEAKPTYATYTWNFGDGTPTVTGYAPGAPVGNPPSAVCEDPWLEPCAASTFHSYQYGGIYEVTLTVTDVGGYTASVAKSITVAGAPRPASGGGSGPAGSQGAVTPASSGSSGGSSGGSGSTLPAPVARAAAASSSPRAVARSGLLVDYSVNEQVAGRFEVLLGAAAAHRLGISGRVASGLPAGTPKSLVIGQALLVTTKGGRNSVRIKFAKSTAAHLSRARSVTLTLRLTAHNASPQSPLFTTVISTVVLHR